MYGWWAIVGMDIAKTWSSRRNRDWQWDWWCGGRRRVVVVRDDDDDVAFH